MTQTENSTLFSNAVPVFMKSFGKLHPEKTFYVIWREKSASGMFSNVFHVLTHLMYARDLGLTPVVDMQHFPTVYNEPLAVNGTRNAWEYYFDQPSPYALDEVYKSKRVIFCYGANNSAMGVYYRFQAAEDTAKRWLRLHPAIVKEADDYRARHFAGHTVLGVHFRGQEMKTAQGHPTPPTGEQMLERAKALITGRAIDRLFVVSEEQGYVDLFKKEFGDMVLSTDAFRTHGENAYQLPEPPRERHMYRLGRELLVDTILLARADYLLAGGYGGLAMGSGVSMMAQMLNGGAYKGMDLIYNGMNPAGPGQMGLVEFVREYFPDGSYRPAP